MKEYTFTLKYNIGDEPETVGVTVYAEEKIKAMHLALDWCEDIGYHPFDAVSMVCDGKLVFG